jgi:hypothetical protein
MASTNAARGRSAAGGRRRVKPTGTLSALANTKKAHNVLLGDIQAHLLKETQKPTDRRQDILHPSEMAKSDWCPRSSFYRLAGVPPTDPDGKFSFALETIFAEGHEIHRKWQQWLWDMGKLWGKWRCLGCRHEWMDTSPNGCPACSAGRSLVVYREVPLEAEAKYLIAGHEDGAVGNDLIEIKSIGQGTLRFEEPALLREYQVETTDGRKIYDLDALWRGLKRPLSSHLRQTGIYLALAKEMGLPHDSVNFLYEYKANQQVKAFRVRYSEDIAAPLLDSALDIKYALETNRTPPRPAFTGRDTKTCKACMFLTHCYQGEPNDSNGESTSPAGGDEDVADVPRRRRNVAAAGPGRPRTAPSGPARPARGHHGVDGHGTDEPVRPADSVVGVRSDPVGSGPGRREVRRRHTRPA